MPALRAVGWMRSAWNRLAACGPSATPFSRKGTSARLRLRATVTNIAAKSSRVLAAVVRRQLHADDQHPRTRGLAGLRHRDQVGLRHRQRQPTQRVVAAEFDDQHRGLVLLQQCRQPRTAARRRVAADAGVDDAQRASSRAPDAAPAARPSRCRVRRPYSADRLSPSTSTGRRRVRGGAAAGTASAAAEQGAALQCAQPRAPRQGLRITQRSSCPQPDHRRSTRHQPGGDSTGTLTILHDIDFALRRANRWPSSALRARARAPCCRSSPDSTYRPPAPCGWPASTCSRSTRMPVPRCVRTRWALSSRVSSCWPT